MLTIFDVEQKPVQREISLQIDCAKTNMDSRRTPRFDLKIRREKRRRESFPLELSNQMFRSVPKHADVVPFLLGFPVLKSKLSSRIHVFFSSFNDGTLFPRQTHVLCGIAKYFVPA